MLAMECLMVMGIPNQAVCPELCCFPQQIRLTDRQGKRSRESSECATISLAQLRYLCGNSMHLAAVGSTMLFGLCAEPL